MMLSTILAQLSDDAGAAIELDALGDLVLLAQVLEAGGAYGETPGEYVSGAARRFAAAASGEEWLALMTALEKSDDPAGTCLHQMVRWSLKRDAAMRAPPSPAPTCLCKGEGSCHDH
jgi:hypothetical protein